MAFRALLAVSMLCLAACGSDRSVTVNVDNNSGEPIAVLARMAVNGEVLTPKTLANGDRIGLGRSSFQGVFTIPPDASARFNATATWEGQAALPSSDSVNISIGEEDVTCNVTAKASDSRPLVSVDCY